MIIGLVVSLVSPGEGTSPGPPPVQEELFLEDGVTVLYMEDDVTPLLMEA